MTGPPSHRTEVRNRRWEWDSTCCPGVHQDGRGGSLAAMIDNPDIRDLAYNSAAAFLAGYVMTKIAGTRDVMLGGIGAAVQTAALVWSFTAGEYAPYTPVWTRIALVMLTGPAMVAGAAVRARAARYL